MTMLDGQHIRQSSLKSVIHILKYWQHYELQTVESVVRTQLHRLDADKFPIFSVG